jgi:hypothetical protein
MERWKEQLGADNDAWKVIEPRFTKVMELNRQTMAGGMGGMFGMRGMRGQRGQGGPGGQQGQGRGGPQGDRPRFPGDENREPSAVEKAQEALDVRPARRLSRNWRLPSRACGRSSLSGRKPSWFSVEC